MSNNTLQHFGVLGMKWGVRRSEAQLARGSKREASEEHTQTRSLMKSKKVSEMSSSEIQKLNARLQLEKQYKDLSKQQVSKGQKFVTDVLSTSGKTVATTVVTSALLFGAKKAIEKKWGPEVLSMLFPKKK